MRMKIILLFSIFLRIICRLLMISNSLFSCLTSLTRSLEWLLAHYGFFLEKGAKMKVRKAI